VFVESLALENYRNYEHLSIQLSPGINIFYGDNAQGKTNILEALYMCATTKSHRGSKDREMLRFGMDEAHMRLILSRDNVGHKIDMHLKKNKAKGIAIDGIPIRKSGELFGLIHMICFSPEDLSMIKNGPGERRRFLDMELCQLDRVYLHDISNYNKIVNQRNNLLKQIGFDFSLKDTLDIWDLQMVHYGKRVIDARKAFVSRLNEWVEPIHLKLTGNKEKLEIVYQPNVSSDEFEIHLAEKRDQDIRMKMSGTGPHRDDFLFMVKGIDIRKYGSQGQQRTAALSLKLAEIELVKQIIHDHPVLLLDDVLSELDSSRQNYLLECISDIQTVITCTGLDEFVNHRFNIDRIFKVTDGIVELIS
jgi:DNA replication and repair protein RecF